MENIRREFEYITLSNVKWKATLTFSHELIVECNCKTQEYQLQPISKIEHDNEYLFLHMDNGKEFYQFKFEDDCFFVGDTFTNDGEFIDSFASCVLREDI